MCIKSLQNKQEMVVQISIRFTQHIIMHLNLVCIRHRFMQQVLQLSNPLTLPASSKSSFGSLYSLPHVRSNNEAHQYFRTAIMNNAWFILNLLLTTNSCIEMDLERRYINKMAYFQPFMGFLDSLLIIFLPPVVAILPEVSQYFPIK